MNLNLEREKLTQAVFLSMQSSNANEKNLATQYCQQVQRQGKNNDIFKQVHRLPCP